MGTKYKNMNKRLLAHYSVHAIAHSDDWLADRKQKKVDHIAKLNKIIDGGEIEDDERGTLQWKGIRHWKYTDTDPNTGIPFNETFKTQQKFVNFRKNQIDSVEDKIPQEERRKLNYDDIIEVKGHINDNKIIVCKTEKEMNDKAGPNDRKIKVKSGKQNLLILVRSGI